MDAGQKAVEQILAVYADRRFFVDLQLVVLKPHELWQAVVHVRAVAAQAIKALKAKARAEPVYLRLGAGIQMDHVGIEGLALPVQGDAAVHGAGKPHAVDLR